MKNIYPQKVISYQSRNVALVIPPSPFLLDERVFVSLGVLRVASSLESKGVDVGVLDLSGVSNYSEALISYLETADIEWIGITCTTPQLPATVKLAKIIRKVSPNLKKSISLFLSNYFGSNKETESSNPFSL